VIRAVMPEFGASGRGFAIHDREVDTMAETYAAARSIYYVLADEAGRVVGGGGIAPLEGGEPDVCELKKMYFLPEARGRGAGRALIEHLLWFARFAGYRRCYLETLKVMEAANRLYLARGFTPLAKPMGATGHFGCDAWYALELEPA
jgi:putative acetyltransferase